MDVRSAERFNGELVGRPELVKGDSQTFYAGMKRMSENSVVNVKNKSFTVTARIVIPEGGADGVLIAQGGAYGGWSVYLTSGALAFAYNLGGVETEYTRSEAPLTPGEGRQAVIPPRAGACRRSARPPHGLRRRPWGFFFLAAVAPCLRGALSSILAGSECCCRNPAVTPVIHCPRRGARGAIPMSATTAVGQHADATISPVDALQKTRNFSVRLGDVPASEVPVPG